MNYLLSESAVEKLKQLFNKLDIGEVLPFTEYNTQSGISYTFEITGSWTQHDNNGAYYCTAKRFYFDPETKKYQLDDDFEYQLYSPADENSEPEYGVGEKVRAIYNGNWEIVAGVGGGESRTFAVVMSAIQCPTDSTASPDDDDDFRDKMGEIKIEGKTYEKDDEDNYKYDKCACRELAGKDDEYPEQIVKGTQIEVIKGGQYDNPDYDPDDEDSDEPEKLDWYVAINTEGIYEGKIAGQVTGNAPDTTITIKDSDQTNITLSVHATALGATQKIEANTGVIVTRINKSLVITKARCPT
jgi:hypothetical protein